MALTGNEPVSAANLKAVLGGGGLLNSKLLFSRDTFLQGGTFRLSEPSGDFDLLALVFGNGLFDLERTGCAIVPTCIAGASQSVDLSTLLGFISSDASYHITASVSCSTVSVSAGQAQTCTCLMRAWGLKL